MRALKPYIENKKHVIWDWNGTLLDDVEMVVTAIGHVLRAQDLPATTVEKYREIFCFPVSEYYRRLGFNLDHFEKLSEDFVYHYMKGIPTCNLHVGVKDLLAEIKAEGRVQSILSAAFEPALIEHLKHFGIYEYFDHVFGLSDHHAKGKVERGRELLRASGQAVEQTILIGDTDHDLEVGRAMGIDVILLGDGHQSYDRLSEVHTKVIPDRHA